MPRTPNSALTNRFDATTDPTTNDDQTAGYESGSVWINASTKEAFLCVSALAGAAVWKTTSTVPEGSLQTPGEVFLGGSLIDYGATGTTAASEIQYTRVLLTAGLTFDRMRTFVDSGGSTGRRIRMGLYSQTTPDDATGVPATKIAETAEIDTINGFITQSLLSPITITTTGFYWIALVVDTTAVKFNITPLIYRADYLPTRRQTTTGTTLPITPGGLTNPLSAVIYVSVMEQ